MRGSLNCVFNYAYFFAVTKGDFMPVFILHHLLCVISLYALNINIVGLSYEIFLNSLLIVCFSYPNTNSSMLKGTHSSKK